MGSDDLHLDVNFNAVRAEWSEGTKAAMKGLHKTTPVAAYAPAVICALLVGTAVYLVQSLSGDIAPTAVMALYVAAVVIPLYVFAAPSTYKASLKVANPRSYVVDKKTGARGNSRFKELVTTPFDDVATLAEFFAEAARRYPRNKCMGARKVINVTQGTGPGGRPTTLMELGDYEWQNYTEVYERIQSVAAGFHARGLKKGDTIAIYANTKAEWIITAHAAFSLGIRVTTVYATLGLEALAYGLDETKVTAIVADASLLRHIAKVIAGVDVTLDDGTKRLIALDTLKTVIFFEDPASRLMNIDADVKSVTAGGRITAVPFVTVEELGSNSGKPDALPPKPDDVAVVMYTSGSTGLPKGVLISHANLMAGIAGLSKSVAGLQEEDTYIGYLPLAHVLELAAEHTLLSAGAAIGYGTPLSLVDTSPGIVKCRGDAPTLKPTVMAAVPAVLDKVRGSIESKVSKSGFIVSNLFKMGYSRKMRALEAGSDAPFWDKLLFDKLRTRVLGGRLRLMLSGGGPLSGATQKFMNVVFACPVGQGYGLTETCGGGTIVWPNDRTVGWVGPPIASSTIRLVDWEDGGYFAKENRGEILISGGNVTLGYLNLKAKTEESFFVEDGQRWFRTGDIGEWGEDGCLKIIDRKKDLVKLSRGEYVSYGKVESILAECELIDRICCYANPLMEYCVAIVVPAVAEAKAHLSLSGDSYKDIAENPELTKAILEDIKVVATRRKLAKFEIPKRLVIASEPFTPENNQLTAALKLKRTQIYKFYKAQLDKVYT